MGIPTIHLLLSTFWDRLQPSPKLDSSFLGMPIGPLWAHKGPILGKKIIILIKNHKIINKNIKIVNLEILKVKTWFWNKDLSSLDSIYLRNTQGKIPPCTCPC